MASAPPLDPVPPPPTREAALDDTWLDSVPPEDWLNAPVTVSVPGLPTLPGATVPPKLVRLPDTVPVPLNVPLWICTAVKFTNCPLSALVPWSTKLLLPVPPI